MKGILSTVLSGCILALHQPEPVMLAPRGLLNLTHVYQNDPLDYENLPIEYGDPAIGTPTAIFHGMNDNCTANANLIRHMSDA